MVISKRPVDIAKSVPAGFFTYQFITKIERFINEQLENRKNIELQPDDQLYLIQYYFLKLSKNVLMNN